MDFVTYLLHELDRRAWSGTELARRAGLSQGLISQVMNGQTKPGQKFFNGVAKALGVPVVDLMRRAGELPPIPEKDILTMEVCAILSRLSSVNRSLMLDYARFLDSKQIGILREPAPDYAATDQDKLILALISQLPEERKDLLARIAQVMKDDG